MFAAYLFYRQMRNPFLLIATAIGLGGLYLFNKANAAKQLIVDFDQIRNLKISGTGLDFDVVFAVQNVSTENITLQNIGGQLFLNDTFVGTAASAEVQQLPRMKTSPVIVKARFQFLNTIGFAAAIVSAIKTKGVETTFIGNAKAVGFTVPFQTKITIKL